MNKKIMLIGSLALILAMGLVFSGCKQGDEGGVVVGFKSAGEPDKVEFLKGRNADDDPHNIYVIRWEAADDAYEYEIVFQATAPLKKTIVKGGDESEVLLYEISTGTNFDGAPTNENTYGILNDDPWYSQVSDANTDVDKWSAVVEVDDTVEVLAGVTKFKLGILTKPLLNNDKNLPIRWSDEFTLVSTQ